MIQKISGTSEMLFLQNQKRIFILNLGPWDLFVICDL